jgi:hypothetical protein
LDNLSLAKSHPGIASPRVLDIHRYSPSRADWGKRFFFCPVISKAHNGFGPRWDDFFFNFIKQMEV